MEEFLFHHIWQKGGKETKAEQSLSTWLSWVRRQWAWTSSSASHSALSEPISCPASLRGSLCLGPVPGKSWGHSPIPWVCPEYSHSWWDQQAPQQLPEHPDSQGGMSQRNEIWCEPAVPWAGFAWRERSWGSTDSKRALRAHSCPSTAELKGFWENTKWSFTL